MSLYKEISLVLLLGAVGSTSINAKEVNHYSQGLQAEILGDFEKAVEELTKSANNRGLKEAKFALGRIYRDKYNNNQESLNWFTEAAEQGSVYAQYELGKLYITGNSALSPDHEEAMRWLTLAVNKGKYADAAFEIFKLSNNNLERLQWLTKAADYGSKEAMNELSKSYKQGKYGMTIDSAKSAQWNKAIKDTQE